MKLYPRGLFLKLFAWLWVTLMLFAVTPIFFFMLGDQSSRSTFFNIAIRETEKRMHVQMRDAAGKDDVAKLKQLIKKAEHKLGVDLYVFDSELKEIRGKVFPEEINGLMDEMKDGKLVLIKRLNQNSQDNRVVRVLKTDNYTIVSYPSTDRVPSFFTIIVQHHIHIFLHILVLSSIASFILTKILAKPLLTLSKAAKNISDGDFSVRVSDKIKSSDEIGALAKDFDTMADKLGKNRENQEAMLRNISHELRSPLTRLRLSLELARKKAGESSQQALDRIENESEKLNEMIGKLLDISRIRDGLNIHKQLINIDELTHPIIRDCGFEAAENGKRLIINADDVSILCDPDLLVSATENIVRNAIKYATEEVKLTVKLSNDQINIIVTDDGNGVEPEKLEDIFTPFYCVQSDRDRKTGGTGLGLAIAKAVADAHSGTITAENTQPHGLSVTISIPS